MKWGDTLAQRATDYESGLVSACGIWCILVGALGIWRILQGSADFVFVRRTVRANYNTPRTTFVERIATKRNGQLLHSVTWNTKTVGYYCAIIYLCLNIKQMQVHSE